MTPRSERDLTGPFWAAVDGHLLVRPVCTSCGRSHFTPQVVCPWCQSPEWRYEPSSGTGEVISHTTIHRPPDPAFTPPYVVADVEMAEGWRLLTWIVDCDPAEVSIGMTVEVRFVPGADGQTLPAFAPADQDGHGRGKAPDHAEDGGAAGPDADRDGGAEEGGAAGPRPGGQR